MSLDTHVFSLESKKARKNYYCCCCGQLIPKKTYYVRENLIYDNDWCDNQYHLECRWNFVINYNHYEDGEFYGDEPRPDPLTIEGYLLRLDYQREKGIEAARRDYPSVFRVEEKSTQGYDK